MARTAEPTGGKPPGLNAVLRQRLKDMSFREIVNIMVHRPPSTLAAGLLTFRTRMAHIEQQLQQRRKPTTEELTRLEFQCFLDIADALGVEIPNPYPEPEADDGVL